MTRHPPFMIAAGATAAMGGSLRIVAMFTVGTFTMQTLIYLYYLIDIFLMLGLVGWYVSRASKLGNAGLAGFIVATAAILMIRSPNLFGQQNYLLGSAMLAAGLAIMNAPTLLRRDGTLLVPTLWLASLACGAISFACNLMALRLRAVVDSAAIVLFGSGFVMAGAELLRIRERT
jgi:hypothetical protein